MSKCPSENWYAHLHGPVASVIEARISIVLCNRSGANSPHIEFRLSCKILYSWSSMVGLNSRSQFNFRFR